MFKYFDHLDLQYKQQLINAVSQPERAAQQCKSDHALTKEAILHIETRLEYFLIIAVLVCFDFLLLIQFSLI